MPPQVNCFEPLLHVAVVPFEAVSQRTCKYIAYIRERTNLRERLLETFEGMKMLYFYNL